MHNWFNKPLIVLMALVFAFTIVVVAHPESANKGKIFHFFKNFLNCILCPFLEWGKASAVFYLIQVPSINLKCEKFEILFQTRS